MALIQCSECGQQVSDKATTCPNCGVAISSATSANNSSKVVKLIWKGKSAVSEIPMEVKVNGKLIGTYSYNSGFEIEIPITSTIMEINLHTTGMNSAIKLTLNPNENYTCNLSLGSMGYFTYNLYNENGALMKTDKLGWGMWALSFFIPIVGIIYFFMKKEEYPAKAKSALMAALIGVGVSILQMLLL